jgi:DNA-binding FadR family transcriptional regulator
VSNNDVSKNTAVNRTAEALRAIAFLGDEGEFLGSEEDMMNKLGVSRPTLRQATALLVQEQLIFTRRGANGGYFVSRPSSMSVSRIAATYLRSRDSKMTDVLRAVEPIRTELARLACRRRDPKIRQQFADFLDREKKLNGEAQDYRAFLRAERDLSRELGDAAGNELLTLFLSIIYDLAALSARDEDVYVNRPDRIERYRALRNQMVEAIAEGDEEMAVVFTRRCTGIVTEWMQEDIKLRRNGSVGHA